MRTVPLTRHDLARQSRFAWACLVAMMAVVAWFLLVGRAEAAAGTGAALAGCLALILPPRERMPRLHWRIRALPREWDAAPVIASLLSAPGYGLEWFYGHNPYDETVHLVSGLLAGGVLHGLLRADERERGAGERLVAGTALGLLLSCGWEAFEWAAGLVGDGFDTATDIALTTGGAAFGTWLAGLRPEARGSYAPLPSSQPR